mgnify:FL=1|jgi:hypothetical protein|tara:strand:+ start:1467 stop:2042 length:576 start_codon:yes stop_codon:yes gene_type:complete
MRFFKEVLMEYVTKYPKTVSLEGDENNEIHVDKMTGVEELHLIVKESAEKMRKILFNEGFTTVKFEHKQPLQIGDGLSLKLKKPWEMHVRLFSNTEDSISIQGEVEISRDYLQHLFSQRTAVIYEIETILKKNGISYDILNKRISKYVNKVLDEYKIKLVTPDIPVFAWKPMLFMIGTVGAMYLWKYLHTL